MPFSWSWFRGLLGLPTREQTAENVNNSRQSKRTRVQRSAIQENGGGQANRARSNVADVENDGNIPVVGVRTRSMARSGEKAALFASIILPLVENEFIGAAELGSLAQVCKAAKEATENDDIWAALCTREFPCTSQFSSGFKEKRGYKWLYRRWCAPVAKRQRVNESPPPIQPPTCRKTQVLFLVNITYDGKPIYSKIHGNIKFLWDTGGVQRTFGKPVILGKAEWDFSQSHRFLLDSGVQSAVPVKCAGFNMKKVEVSIHVFREKDGALFCVCRSQDRRREMSTVKVRPFVADGELLTKRTQFDLASDQRQEALSFRKLISQERLSFSESWKALQVLHKLPYPVHFGCGLCFGVVEGGQFAITGFVISALWTNVATGAVKKFNSLDEEKKHGVTLLHILGHLKGE